MVTKYVFGLICGRIRYPLLLVSLAYIIFSLYKKVLFRCLDLSLPAGIFLYVEILEIRNWGILLLLTLIHDFQISPSCSASRVWNSCSVSSNFFAISSPPFLHPFLIEDLVSSYSFQSLSFLMENSLESCPYLRCYPNIQSHLTSFRTLVPSAFLLLNQCFFIPFFLEIMGWTFSDGQYQLCSSRKGVTLYLFMEDDFPCKTSRKLWIFCLHVVIWVVWRNVTDVSFKISQGIFPQGPFFNLGVLLVSCSLLV